jgi:putative FmdB family regulatory protein
MPMYDYRCAYCGDSWEQLARIEQTVYCDRCPETRAERLISAPAVIQDNLDARSYYDDGLGARITSRSQRKALMRAKGVEEVGRGANTHGSKGTVFSFKGQATSSVPASGAYAAKH